MSHFQLYLADAIDLMRSLPSESVDLIVTDVAYESLEKHRATGTTTRLKKSDGSSNEWFPIFGNERFEEFFSESFRVLKKNTHLYFYCDEDTADVAKPIGRAAGFTFWKSLVWAKTRQNTKPDADDLVVEHQALGMSYHYRASKEFILFFEKGKRKLTDLGVRDVLPFPTIRNGYPTEKPVDLNKVFIRLSSLPGETVLDPFMGSASAGVAAMKLGRDFIGGDVKDTAVAAADVRLKANEGQSRGEAIVLQASAERPARPEPPPKKKRAKKVILDEDVFDEDDLRAPPPAPCEHSFMGKPRMCGKCGVRDDSPPLVTTDAPLPPIGTREPPHDYDGSLDALEARPKYRAYAFADGKVQGEVPNVMFDVKVSDAPLPQPTGPGFIAQLEQAFAHVGPLTCQHGDLVASCPLCKEIDQVERAPVVALCRHNEPRTSCVLCRARR